MTFTSEEIEATVEGLVRSTVRTPTGVLGERDLLTAQNDLMEVAGAVYLTGGVDALLWTEWLGLQRARADLADLIVLLGDVEASVAALGRSVDSDVDTTHLVDMQAALTALAGTLTERTSGHAVSALSSVPAFQRLLTSSKAFLDGPAQNVRSGGQIVSTPQTARSALLGQLVSLESGWTALRDKLTGLFGGPESLLASNLSGRTGATTIRRAKSAITTTIESIGTTANERMENLRDVVLQVLSARAVVAGLAVQETSLPADRGYSGVLTAFAESTKPAVPAKLLGTRAGPYEVGTHTLELSVDGTPTSVELLASFRCQFESNVEPFDIHAASPGVESNRELTVRVNGVDYPILLGIGSARTAQQVADDINVYLYGFTNVAATAIGEVGSRRVLVEALTYATGDTLETPASNAQATLGFLADYVWESRPTGATELVRQITATQAGLLATTRLVPTLTTTVRTDPARLPIVRARGIGSTTTPTLTSIELTDPTAPFGGVRVGDLVTLLSGSGTGTVWIVETVSSTVLTATGSSVAPTDPLVQYVVSTERSSSSYYLLARRGVAVGTITRVGANVLRFTPTDGSIVSSTHLRVVSGLNAGTLWGSVTPTTGYVEATGTLEPIPDTNVTVEFTSSLGATAGQSVELLDSVNQGTYEIDFIPTDPRDDPGEIGLLYPLPRSSLDGAPLPVEASAQIGGLVVDLASRSVGTNTSLSVTGGTGAALLYTTTPTPAVGSTVWISTPETAPLAVGDRIRVYTVDYAVPTLERFVVAIDGLHAQLDEAVSTTSSFDLSAQTVPYARVGWDGYLSFLELAEAATAILDGLPENYFLELSRLARIVLQFPTPPLYVLADLSTSLSTLSATLTSLSAELDTFLPERYVEVETLLSSLRERGSDRAADLLLEGRFSEVFSLPLDRMSYSAEVLYQLRETTRSDLPVSAVNRNRRGPVVLSRADSVDFEYDRSDIDESSNPDIP